ncbi:hypothetical protein D3C80_1088840 [compost metagenome]
MGLELPVDADRPLRLVRQRRALIGGAEQFGHVRHRDGGIRFHEQRVLRLAGGLLVGGAQQLLAEPLPVHVVGIGDHPERLGEVEVLGVGVIQQLVLAHELQQLGGVQHSGVVQVHPVDAQAVGHHGVAVVRHPHRDPVMARAYLHQPGFVHVRQIEAVALPGAKGLHIVAEQLDPLLRALGLRQDQGRDDGLDDPFFDQRIRFLGPLVDLGTGGGGEGDVVFVDAALLVILAGGIAGGGIPVTDGGVGEEGLGHGHLQAIAQFPEFALVLLGRVEGEVLVPVVDAEVFVPGDHDAAIGAGALADDETGAGVGTGAKQAEQGGGEETQGVFFHYCA